MDPYALKTLNAERRARRAAVLVTDLGDGRDRIVREGDHVAGDLGAAIARTFRTGSSGSVQAEGRTFFLNGQAHVLCIANRLTPEPGRRNTPVAQEFLYLS